MSVLNTLQTIMPNGISRREFLRRAGSVGVGLLGTSSIARLPWDTAEAASVANVTDYADLAAQLTGSLVLPSDASYATARLVWNTLYDNRYPQAVVKAATPQDVQVAINFARDMGLQPIARAGGHSFQGYSTGSGLVIDVAGLNDVTMNAGRTRARIGAGTNLLRIYGVLAQRGMAIPGGSCPTVGISGLTQGGGIGPFTRQYGLTLDRLIGAQIVTADGRLLRVNARENSDLFWAIRGGGGGHFGVVTAFEFVPIPASAPNTTVSLIFPWQHAERVMLAFQQWVPTVPLNAHPGMMIRTTTAGPGAEPEVTVSLWHRGRPAKCTALVDEFIREVGVRPTSRTVESGRFFDVEFDEYCAGLTLEQCAMNERDPGGEIPRFGLSTYSEITRHAWPSDGVAALLDQIERHQRSPVLQPLGVPASLQTGKIIIEPIDGRAGRVSPTATAFPHRGCFLTMQYQARVPKGASPDLVAASQEWLDGLYSRLAPWRTGQEYSNYGNRKLRDWANAYYGRNLPRLRRIKTRRDPQNLFQFSQSIPPSS